MPRKVDGYAVRCCRHIDVRMRSDCYHYFICINLLKNKDMFVFCPFVAFLSKGGWVCRLN